MSEDAPVLGLDSNTIWQYSQTFIAISGLVARIRARRESEGRLAQSDSEHAARLHEARQHPPIRLMSDDEQLEWQRRVPSELAAEPHGEPFSVWTAQMVDAEGKPTGEWGLEGHTWNRGSVTSSLMVVCRDAEDALALSQHLREQGTVEHLGYLHDLAIRGHGQFVDPPAPKARQGTTWAINPAPPLVLSEHDWESALRWRLPPEIADRIIVKDPAHPHHAAWRELHELANEEVTRLGADPDRLAILVDTVPHWDRDNPRYPASSLAHWAITKSRTTPGYQQFITPHSVTGPTSVPDAVIAAHAESVAGRVRLTEVQSPEQALVWAQGLDKRNPEHRVEAKLGFGRWGSEVDGILATKFSGLVHQANAAVTKTRKSKTAPQAGAPIVVEVGEPVTDPATLQAVAAEINQLDPSRRGDRRAAHVMFGHNPYVDRLIAERFADDPLIIEKVQIKYPDGLPEADAAMWRNRAQGDDAVAAAQAALPDDPQTPPREDLDAEVASRGERGLATAQRGIATTVAGQQPEVVRRTVTQPTPGGPSRRT